MRWLYRGRGAGKGAPARKYLPCRHCSQTMTGGFRKGARKGFSHFAGQEWPPAVPFWKDKPEPAALSLSNTTSPATGTLNNRSGTGMAKHRNPDDPQHPHDPNAPPADAGEDAAFAEVTEEAGEEAAVLDIAELEQGPTVEARPEE